MQPCEQLLGFILECKFLQLERTVARQWYHQYSERLVRLPLAYANVVEDSVT